MGHGASRELESSTELPDLDPAIAARLSQALDALDARDPAFKAARDEERIGLLIKQWNTVCREMDDHLRTIGKVLVGTHQLSLDIGSDGGGLSQKPFLEDLRDKFPKLRFRLDESGKVHAFTEVSVIGSGSVDDVDYDWVLGMVTEWVVVSASKC